MVLGLKETDHHRFNLRTGRRNRARLLILSVLLKSLLGLLLGAALSCEGAPASTRTTLNYVVTRDDHPVGRYDFLIVDQPDRREVTAQMNIRIKLLFLTVYRAEHQRRDFWVEGRLDRSSGQSTYNGKSYDFGLAQRDDGYVLQINGAVEKITGPVMTFVPWWPEVAGQLTLLTEKGRANSVIVERLKDETLTLAGKEILTRKFIVRGRRDQELWYDAQGILQRVRYTHRGSVIELQLTPRAAPTRPTP